MKRFVSSFLSLILGIGTITLINSVDLKAEESEVTKIVYQQEITDVNKCSDITNEHDKTSFEKRIIINTINSQLLEELNSEKNSNIKPTFWDRWEIKNFRKDNYNIIYPNNPLRVSTYGPGKGRMSINQIVAVGFTASTGISFNMVEARVGFSLKASYGIEDTQEIQVPRGKRGRITAYTLYAQWRMDVYKNGKYVGQEFVHKPIGVSFNVDIFNK